MWIGAGAIAQDTVPAWRLVWQDEFELPDGSCPSQSRWTYNVGGTGWGNEELQYYTNYRLENARIEGGHLVIEARKEEWRVGDSTWHYTSARIKTEYKADWTYGRFEARIKLPAGAGLWPAFWMLGSDYWSAGWPACGEIDIMENIGSELGTVHGSAHGPGFSGPAGSHTRSYTLPNGARFSDGFHLFAIEWAAGVIRWYVDHDLFFTVTPAMLPPDARWVFNHRFFIILNVAVGGTWPGDPLPTTRFPQRMLVDYVRVYARASVAAPSLRVECGADGVEVLWPVEFPHARLQRSESITGGFWMDVPLTGTMRGTEFVAQVAPGFYRLVTE